MHSGSSESESDEEDIPSVPIGVGKPGEPYCKCQGAFLSNLVKMLNESGSTSIDLCMRWHPKIRNAMQVHWKRVHEMFDMLHPILVMYKLCRLDNNVKCARSTWNRKLREWSFTMVNTGGEWTSYIYSSDAFSPDASYYVMPYWRR